MNVLVPIWKRSKKRISRFAWKYVSTLVGKSYTYKLDMGSLVGNGWFYHALVQSNAGF